MKLNVKRLAMLALGASAGVVVSAAGAALADDRGGWRQGGGYQGGGYQGGGYHGGGYHRGWHHGGWHHGGGGPGNMSRGFMRRYDANKDGEVTQEEIDTNRVARHGKYDANGDGKLSLEEFQGLWLEAYRRRMVREFQEFDVDGDAAVTLEEYIEPMSDFVERREDRGYLKSRRGMRRGSAAPSDSTKPAE